MDPVFTLPFSEYEAINELRKKLRGGASFYIPTSRQQKGIDFIIHNNQKNKLLRIQVKSSRSYIDEPHERRDKRKTYKYHLWFNNFYEKYSPGNADYYLLFGLYPEYKIDKNIKSKRVFWNSMIILFTEKEIFSLLRNIKLTKSNRADRFFDIAFDNENIIFASRGFNRNINLSKHLLKNQLNVLKKRLQIDV